MPFRGATRGQDRGGVLIFADDYGVKRSVCATAVSVRKRAAGREKRAGRGGGRVAVGMRHTWLSRR